MAHVSRLDRDSVLSALTLDADNPASVVACIGRAREGARTVRDVLSQRWVRTEQTYQQQNPNFAQQRAQGMVRSHVALAVGSE